MPCFGSQRRSRSERILAGPSRLGRFLERKSDGFSLVEVAVALGIVAVAMMSIMALVPLGLTTMHEAVEINVQTRVVQQLHNEARQTPFNRLSGAPGAFSAHSPRYYTDEGDEVASSDPAATYVAFLTVAPRDTWMAFDREAEGFDSSAKTGGGAYDRGELSELLQRVTIDIGHLGETRGRLGAELESVTSEELAGLREERIVQSFGFNLADNGTGR